MAIAPKLFKKMSKLISGSMTAGHYDVRLAANEAELQAAQQLRYEVLFRESGGKATHEMLNAGREEDNWDAVAYHVVVLDTRDNNRVVGTVRLVARSELDVGQSFYTEQAFKLDPLFERYPNALELSRACVSPHGRGGAILMLIWKFTMQFIEKNGFDVMFGCASFKGTDYAKHEDILSYLYTRHLASTELMPHPQLGVEAVAIQPSATDKGDLGKVPTMLKGYLKIGARISDHAIIDPVFNTTFVAIYVVADEMFNTNHALVNKAI